ncbi:hypothetical protein CC78DRAFT_578389 [Lojkania enalia]|uniref:Uncharacterized protein n=1 Tax=Lojkania enalia TaxID=147567 RepID=A0A9P4N4Z2_9PLEO|nr:hypothetical protein CC78DRAFT_578389 [Didymosphaeria enalia]
MNGERNLQLLELYEKHWDPDFSQDRQLGDDKPYFPELARNCGVDVNLITEIREEITIFFQDDEEEPCCEVDELQEFCEGARTDDIHFGIGSAGHRAAAWLDDRTSMRRKQDPSYSNTMCKTQELSIVTELEPSSSATSSTKPRNSQEDDVSSSEGTSSTLEDISIKKSLDVADSSKSIRNRTVREYPARSTASGLDKYLQQKRIGHVSLPDANRRLLYVVNLDAYYISALIRTAPFHQVSTLRDAIWKHVAFQTAISVKLPAHEYKVFQLECHIPHLELTCTSKPNDWFQSRWMCNPRRKWKDVYFLKRSWPKARVDREFYIHETQFSLAICGSDHSRWTAYAFNDDFEDDGSVVEPFSYEKFEEDPIIGSGKADANKPLGDPREYFLAVMEHRMGHVIRKYKNVVRPVERYIKTDMDRHYAVLFSSIGPMGNEAMAARTAFNWIRDSMIFLRWIEESLSRTIDAWTVFTSADGDIGYFSDLPSSPSWSLRAIKSHFDSLKECQRIVSALDKSCQDSCRILGLRLNLDGHSLSHSSNQLNFESNILSRKSNDLTKESLETTQHNGLTAELTLSIIAPITIALAYFQVEQNIVPFQRNTKTLIGCIVVLSLVVRAFVSFGALARQYGWWKVACNYVKARWTRDRHRNPSATADASQFQDIRV